MKGEYMIINYDCEKKDIPPSNSLIILDVKHLKTASTTFLHKLLDVRERVVLINLHSQPEQVFNICGLGSIVKTFKNIEDAKKHLDIK